MIIFAGDWHGNFGQARAVVLRAQRLGVTKIVHVGDFDGPPTSHAYLDSLDRLCARCGVTIFFVDGNHEDFPYLDSLPLNADGTKSVRENIIYLPRGLRWQWEGVSFLAMGGAYSVDRPWRTKDVTYFDAEELSDTDVNVSTDPVDILVSHDCPAGAPNTITDTPILQAAGIRMFGEDQIARANLHRGQLARVSDAVDPRVIVHGHYHVASRKTYTRPGGRECLVVALDQGGERRAEIDRNTWTLDLSQLAGDGPLPL